MFDRGLGLIALTMLPITGIAQTAPPRSPPATTANRVLEEVTVASTPLGGLELPMDRVPGNLQRATSNDLDQVRRAGLAQFMDQRLGSVFINEAQGNPLQPDVQYRGFVASPLLGQPQGIAVYQNGVRMNDPFGDVVNWALIPESAIASIDLIPGSNPVFGLNTLGGALSIHTKNGFTDPGTSAEVMGGSFGREAAQVESGGNVEERLSYYVSANYLKEDGWRQFSPTEALQLFGNTGWRGVHSSLELSATWVDTDLVGNGPAPVQLLRMQRDAIYTAPDRTQNSFGFVTLSGSHSFSPDVQLEGVTYYRRSDIDALNGDESHFDECEDAPELVCDEQTGEVAHDPGGAPIEFDEAVEGATLNRSSTRQDTYGASAQLGITQPLGRRGNRFILGGSADRSKISFASSTELGSFDDARRAVPGGAVVQEAAVGLHTNIENLSAFFTDTLALTPKLDLTLAARYNDTHIELRDQIGTALDGDHDFSRLNGSAGITYRNSAGVRFYADYSESNRAPSPVELTCADEDAPCALPNAFLSDPPLQQVVAKTIEAGVRGTWRNTRWHAGAFRTTNRNDIIFVSAGALTNRGFFENVGDTRRQGIEINLKGKLAGQRMDWFLHYTLLDAEFLANFRVASPNNPAAENGEIEVRSGSRIPSVPEQLLKAGASVRLLPQLTVAMDVLYQSNQFYRGDEGNLTAPVPGFTLVNASAEWQLGTHLTLFAQVENLFDENYASFGLFGAADEVLGDDYEDPRFVSPGAPRSAWVGVRLAL